MGLLSLVKNYAASIARKTVVLGALLGGGLASEARAQGFDSDYKEPEASSSEPSIRKNLDHYVDGWLNGGGYSAPDRYGFFANGSFVFNFPSESVRPRVYFGIGEETIKIENGPDLRAFTRYGTGSLELHHRGEDVHLFAEPYVGDRQIDYENEHKDPMLHEKSARIGGRAGFSIPALNLYFLGDGSYADGTIEGRLLSGLRIDDNYRDYAFLVEASKSIASGDKRDFTRVRDFVGRDNLLRAYANQLNFICSGNFSDQKWGELLHAWNAGGMAGIEYVHNSGKWMVRVVPFGRGNYGRSDSELSLRETISRTLDAGAGIEIRYGDHISFGVNAGYRSQRTTLDSPSEGIKGRKDDHNGGFVEGSVGIGF